MEASKTCDICPTSYLNNGANILKKQLEHTGPQKSRANDQTEQGPQFPPSRRHPSRRHSRDQGLLKLSRQKQSPDVSFSEMLGSCSHMMVLFSAGEWVSHCSCHLSPSLSLSASSPTLPVREVISPTWLCPHLS